MPVFKPIKQTIQQSIQQQSPDATRDIFVHALFARVALSDGNTIEFETKYDEKTNTIELQIPNQALPIFDELQGIQRGPKFKAYIDWLIGKSSIQQQESTSDIDTSYIPAGSFDVWTGAKIGNFDDEKIVVFLPTDCLSVVGCNFKLPDGIATSDLDVSLVWIYESGNSIDPSAKFTIQTSVNVNQIGTTSIATVNQDTDIATFNLIHGDVRETNLISVSNVIANDIISITLRRNFNGSSDPETEFIGILGVKISIS